MGQQIGAPGQYLPTGQFGYPTGLQNAPINLPGNQLTLWPGQEIYVPPGNFYVDPGLYSFLQVLDPVTQIWRTLNTGRGSARYIKSDGFNVRVGNYTGCPIGAIVTDGGDGDWVQSTTTVSPSVGNSTWQAIVGGMASVVSVASAGAGYGVPPIVLIAPPAAPGIQATGYASIASGTVSGITLTNVGGGYTSVPEVRIIPNPTDPNISSGITNATVSLALVGGSPSRGSIAGILCTNPGVSVASVPTLSIAGAGTGSPAATAVRLTTLTGATVQGGGAGWTGNAVLTTGAGRPSGATPLYTNPATDFTQFVPRPANADLFASGGSLISVAAVYDGGLFAGTPTAIVIPQLGALITSSASVTLTTGAAADTVYIQPAP